MDLIKASECGLRTLTFGAGAAQFIQWSIPVGFRAVIQTEPATANNVFISTQDPNLAGANTPSWVLQPLISAAAGGQYGDRIDFPSGYPAPLWFTGTTGDSITIFIMPCGKGEGGY